MPTVVTGITASGLRDQLETALTAGAWTLNVSATNYTVVDLDVAGQDSIHISNPSSTELTIRVGLNWDDSEGAFVHPDDGIYDTCEDPTFPGEIWSATVSLGTATGAVTRDAEWLAWHGRDGTEVRVAATPLDRGGNDYQSFAETLTCQCNGPDDPVAECSGSDDTFTYDTTGYRGYTYAAVLLRGPGITDTYGTLTGSATGDIRTQPTSARLGNDEYGRDQEWAFDDHQGNLAGTHEHWIVSDDDPVNLATRGTFSANGTYTSPKPAADDAVYKQ